jgi:hypothetical protein
MRAVEAAICSARVRSVLYTLALSPAAHDSPLAAGLTGHTSDNMVHRESAACFRLLS